MTNRKAVVIALPGYSIRRESEIVGDPGYLVMTAGYRVTLKYQDDDAPTHVTLTVCVHMFQQIEIEDIFLFKDPPGMWIGPLDKD